MTTPLHSLSAKLDPLRNRRRHLHGLLGGHIGALEKSLGRISSRKAAASRQGLLAQASSFFSTKDIVSGFLNGAGTSVGKMLAPSDDASSDGQFFGMSEGQIWADAASAISRAMKRNL